MNRHELTGIERVQAGVGQQLCHRCLPPRPLRLCPLPSVALPLLLDVRARCGKQLLICKRHHVGQMLLDASAAGALPQRQSVSLQQGVHLLAALLRRCLRCTARHLSLIGLLCRAGACGDIWRGHQA